MAQIQHGFNRNDEYYIPAYAVCPILNYLKPASTIWCPFDTEESQYVKIFTENGFTVIHGHIRTGQDFFSVPVPDCDYIISNPPYSRKGEVIKRLYEIGKPEKRAPFQSGYLCSGICESQLEFAYIVEKDK